MPPLAPSPLPPAPLAPAAFHPLVLLASLSCPPSPLSSPPSLSCPTHRAPQIQELVEAIVLPIKHKDRFIKLGIKPPKV